MTRSAQNARPDALVLHQDDDIAVVLRDIAAGERIQALNGADLCLVDIRTALPTGHKVAMHDMMAGHRVRKYGEIIGELTAPVVKGEHVHVHNLVSLRAR